MQLDRLLAEPGTAGRHVAILNAILANSHRFAHASMALDAYRSRISATPGRLTFLVFAADVEKALTFLAATLRGTHIPSEDSPDLREHCNRLMESGDSRTERYALTNIGADRITNSLNTLRDEVISWAGAGGPNARASGSSAMQKPKPFSVAAIAHVSKSSTSHFFAQENAKNQRDDIVRSVTESDGRVGSADGAAARLG